MSTSVEVVCPRCNGTGIEPDYDLAGADIRKDREGDARQCVSCLGQQHVRVNPPPQPLAPHAP